MRAFLVCGAVALMAGGCTSAPTPPQINALRVTAAAKASPGFVEGGPAEIMLSRQFIIHSKHAGRDYLIQVCQPIPPIPTATAADLDTMFPNRDAVAIYVLDGGSDFGIYCAIARDVFVVGIAHFGVQLQDMIAARERDFVHVKHRFLPNAGEADKFAAFVTDELKPFIESRFPVDPKKAVLTGQSLGGLFTLHMLADNPDAFWSYMICTPSVGYDGAVVDKVRETALRSKGQHVFFGADGPTPEDKPFFDRVLASLTPPGGGFAVEHRTFPDEDHGSVGPAFMSAAVRWLAAQSRPQN